MDIKDLSSDWFSQGEFLGSLAASGSASTSTQGQGSSKVLPYGFKEAEAKQTTSDWFAGGEIFAGTAQSSSRTSTPTEASTLGSEVDMFGLSPSLAQTKAAPSSAATSPVDPQPTTEPRAERPSIGQWFRSNASKAMEGINASRESMSRELTGLRNDLQAFDEAPLEEKPAIALLVAYGALGSAGRAAMRSLRTTTASATDVATHLPQYTAKFAKEHPFLTATVVAGTINHYTDIKVTLPQLDTTIEHAGPVARTLNVEPVVKEVGGQQKTVGFVGQGPVVQDAAGKLLSERSKTYDLKESDGTPITSRERAEQRAQELIQWGAAIDRTPEQAEKVAADEAQHALEMAEFSLGQPKETRLRKPDTRPREAEGELNVYLPDRPKAKTFVRGQWNHHREVTSTDPSPVLNALIVPNIVVELGEKRGVAGAAPNYITVSKQPLDLFVPLTGGFEGFHATTTIDSAYTSVKHPAGFYPGDPNQTLGETYRDDPSKTSELQINDFFGQRNYEPRNFWQAFYNAPNALAPWVNASLNYRAVANRHEFDAFALNSTDTTDGKNGSDMLFVPYTWHQNGQVKVGIGNVAGNDLFNGKPIAPYAHVGTQHEVGIYLVNHGRSFAPRDPQSKDWHIVNGEVTDGKQAWEQQFAPIEAQHGVELRTESVLPALGETTAGVYVQVPTSPSAQVTVSQLASQLQQIGQADPDYPELGTVTAETLLQLNPQADDGPLTVEGGSGLYVPTEQIVESPTQKIPSRLPKGLSESIRRPRIYDDLSS
jgi:hypothetical protein